MPAVTAESYRSERALRPSAELAGIRDRTSTTSKIINCRSARARSRLFYHYARRLLPQHGRVLAVQVAVGGALRLYYDATFVRCDSPQRLLQAP